MNKKADGGLTAVVIILVIVVFLGYLINVGGRECRTNKDCGEDYYCGSDFACHKFQVIEKTSESGNYVVPALIVGIALIVTAIILKWDKISESRKAKKQDKQKEETKEAVHYDYPLYYTEQVKSK